MNAIPNGAINKSEPAKANLIAAQVARISKTLVNSKNVPLEPQKNLNGKLSISSPKSSDSLTFHGSIWSMSTCSLNSLKDNTDSRDINDLLNYIEGNKNVDKVALAQKKAAKKARQREKKVS